MKIKIVDNIPVEITGDVEPDEVEIAEYIKLFRHKEPTLKLKSLKLEFDGEYVDVYSNYSAIPFERIRRIIGYLVGTLDRFNDAKAAEEKARVKHRL
jgi:hypothetical protein